MYTSPVRRSTRPRGTSSRRAWRRPGTADGRDGGMSSRTCGPPNWALLPYGGRHCLHRGNARQGQKLVGGARRPVRVTLGRRDLHIAPVQTDSHVPWQKPRSVVRTAQPAAYSSVIQGAGWLRRPPRRAARRFGFSMPSKQPSDGSPFPHPAVIRTPHFVVRIPAHLERPARPAAALGSPHVRHGAARRSRLECPTFGGSPVGTE